MKTVFKDIEVKKMVLGTVIAICVCTFLFTGFSQAGKFAIFENAKTVPTNYNIDLTKGSTNSDIPSDYVKPNYTVKTDTDTPTTKPTEKDIPTKSQNAKTVPTNHNINSSKSSINSDVHSGYVKPNYTVKIDTDISTAKPTEKDMSEIKAAELGAQNLWQLFNVNLNNQTINMAYIPADDYNPRALWFGEVNIDDKLLYRFDLDAVTGEYNSAFGWDFSEKHIYSDRLNDYQEYVSLGKDIAEKYHFVSGKIISSKFFQERTTGKVGSGLVIDIAIKSDNGQEAMVTLLKDSKKLVSVDYDSEVKRLQYSDAADVK